MGLEILNKLDKNRKPCLLSCSVLKDELHRLILRGDLDADIMFVSKNFHVDYALLEKNLRETIQRTMTRFSEKPILVYGDLCLGPNGEMKQLADEYGLVKIDALNCVDCLLGGHGRIEEADPNHELMFFDPGMIEFFRDAKKKLAKEGMIDDALRNLFSGIKGIVLLDTLENAEKCKIDIEKIDTGLSILETKKVGVESLLKVLSEAIQKNQERTKQNTYRMQS